MLEGVEEYFTKQILVVQSWVGVAEVNDQLSLLP